MYRKIIYEKYQDYHVERFYVTCQGLRSFRITGTYHPHDGYDIWGVCYASTKYLYNAFVSVFGSGSFDITLSTKQEAYDLIENFIALVDTMNASFEEEEKLKKEKLKQYRKDYYQRKKEGKAKVNAITRSGRSKQR